MTFTLVVLDRGRPIATHPKLDREVSTELVDAYRAIGWPEEKILVQPDEPAYLDDRAAA